VANRCGEERLRHDFQRQAHYVGVDVPRFARMPAVEHGVREVHHHHAVFLDLVELEGRLRQPPLSAPQLAFTGEESLAQHCRQHSSCTLVLDEVAMMAAQDVFDVLWMADDVGLHWPDADADDVSVFGQFTCHESERIATEIEEVADERNTLDERRKTFLIHFFLASTLSHWFAVSA